MDRVCVCCTSFTLETKPSHKARTNCQFPSPSTMNRSQYRALMQIFTCLGNIVHAWFRCAVYLAVSTWAFLWTQHSICPLVKDLRAYFRHFNASHWVLNDRRRCACIFVPSDLKTKRQNKNGSTLQDNLQPVVHEDWRGYFVERNFGNISTSVEHICAVQQRQSPLVFASAWCL